MIKYLIILSFPFCAVIYSPHKTSLTHQAPPIDTSHYAVLKYERKMAPIFNFEGINTASDISSADINTIEKIIKNATKKTNVHNAQSYYKQFIAVIDSKGDKVVWVNCFCSNYEKINWHQRIIGVLDGGACYFNLKINLTKGTYYDLAINGIA